MKRRIVAILAVFIMCAFCTVTAFAAGTPARVVDEADVLTAGEEQALKTKLDNLSEKHKVDFVVVTVESLGGEDCGDFTADYFIDNGYGQGADKDGVMLLFSAEVVDGGRDYYIYYSGIGFDAINNEVEDVKDAIVGYLRNDDFVEAFNTFADECDSLIDIEINGEPFAFFKSLLISVAIGFGVSFVSVTAMKSQLKSVRMQKGATNYVKAGSLNITNSRDIFLYRSVTKRARPKSNSGGGSRSSGGSRSGGSGGKC